MPVAEPDADPLAPAALPGFSVAACMRDGAPLLIRAVLPGDKDALTALLHRLSPTSSYFRFFGPKQAFSRAELVYYTEVDFREHVALLAISVHEQQVVGVARYIVTPPGDEAEVAFTVDDAHQGRGIATLLLEQLTRIAIAAGLRRFIAHVLPENRPMLDVFGHCGLDETLARDDGEITVRLALDAPRLHDWPGREAAC